MATTVDSQKITPKRLLFPEKSIIEISTHEHDPIPYLIKLEMNLNSFFPGLKRIPLKQMEICKNFTELEHRVKNACRIHLEAETLTFENALAFLERKNLTVLDELTYVALLDLSSASKNEIPDFGCVAMPFLVQKQDELIKACFVYPSRKGTGEPYIYTKNIEYVEQDAPNRANLFEFFVMQ